MVLKSLRHREPIIRDVSALCLETGIGVARSHLVMGFVVLPTELPPVDPSYPSRRPSNKCKLMVKRTMIFITKHRRVIS